MAYTFQGFFVRVSEHTETQHIINDVRQHWPSAAVRPITDPFSGIGVQFPKRSKS